MFTNILALPKNLHRATVRVALDTSNTVGIDDQLIMDSEDWEDIPMDMCTPAEEGQVDPSHEGGEYNHFIDMVDVPFLRYFISIPGNPLKPFLNYIFSGSDHNITV